MTRKAACNRSRAAAGISGAAGADAARAGMAPRAASARAPEASADSASSEPVPASALSPPPVPAAVWAGLGGAAGWRADLVWAHDPAVATWRLRGASGQDVFVKVSRGGRAGFVAEARRLRWAAPWFPCPEVLGEGRDGDRRWLITRGLPGVPAHLAVASGAPKDAVVVALARGLAALHAIPAAECPFRRRTPSRMEVARRRVAAGSGFDLHEDLGLGDGPAALRELERLRPAVEDVVVGHGDYCLPNVLLVDGQAAGYLDLGALGVADRWSDLAVATWSIQWNLGPGWQALFLEAYGLRERGSAVADRLAFYRILYDMCP